MSEATREELIEREAKRLCLANDYSLDRLACQDRRYRHDDRRPWWQAEYVPLIKSDIKRLENAGFSVTPAAEIDRLQARVREMEKKFDLECDSYAKDSFRAKIIERCARELETSYPDHAWLNAACAAIRALVCTGDEA